MEIKDLYKIARKSETYNVFQETIKEFLEIQYPNIQVEITTAHIFLDENEIDVRLGESEIIEMVQLNEIKN